MKRLTLCMSLLVAAIVASTTFAGPPLICHPFSIDDAKCIAWGNGPFDAPRIRDSEKWIDEVVAVLDGSDVAIVHMETLRRATIACARTTTSSSLLARLLARALNAEASGKPDAFALFDVGFFAQSLDQYGSDSSAGCGVKKGIIGYAYISRAMEVAPNNAQFQFAAALMTAIHNKTSSDLHLARANVGARHDKLLAMNITNFQSELGEHLAHHRSNHARRKGH